MDREIPPSERRRQRLRSLLPWGIGLVATVVLVALLPGWIRPSVDRDRLRIGVVDVGAVEDALQGSGTVVPSFEKVLVSPIEARVLRVFEHPGDPVEAGDPILELDLSAARLTRDRAEERLDQRRTTAERTLADLERKVERRTAERRQASLELEMATFEREQQATLLAEGLVSETVVRKAEVAKEKAALALEQAERDLDSARDELAATRRSLDQETELLVKERDEAARLLELGTARADRNGVVTWVVDREGVMVSRGDEIARVADLSRFAVEGTLPSMIADRLSPGQPVRIEIDPETALDGAVSSVDPTIEERIARFEVRLDEPSHPKLRNRLQVDLWVIPDRRESAVRVPKGPFAAAEGGRIAWVLAGDRLVRRSIELGLTGVDHYEVISGLEPGDEIVLSNLEEFSHLQEIELR